MRKKLHSSQNWPLVKNPQFLPYPHETWSNWLTHEVVNLVALEKNNDAKKQSYMKNKCGIGCKKTISYKKTSVDLDVKKQSYIKNNCAKKYWWCFVDTKIWLPNAKIWTQKYDVKI